MFEITNRQTPMFRLTDIKELAEIAEFVFNFQSIVSQHLTPFNLDTTVRINQFNRKVFFAEDVHFSLEYEKYVSRLELTDFSKKAKDVLKQKNSKIFSSIPDFYSGEFSSIDLPAGDYLCILNKYKIPTNIKHFIAISADLAVQTGLLRFKNYDIDCDKAIGLAKIQNFE